MTDVDTQEKRQGQRANSPWRNEDLCKRVHALWKDHSASQIAEKIWLEFRVELSRNSVVGYLHRQKLTVEEKTEVHPLTRVEGVKRPPARPRARTAVNVRSINAAMVAPKIKPEPFVIECAEVDPLNIAIVDLQDHHCRFVYGDNPATMTFCGQPKAEGSSYCRPHRTICCTGVPERRGGVSPAAFGKARGGVFGRVA